MASVIRILFLCVLATTVPASAWLLDPGLGADTHVYVVGALVTVFVAIDYLFGQLMSSFASLSRSSVLTLAESRRLENQLRASRSHFKLVWGTGVALRMAHAVLVALALGAQPGTPLEIFSLMLAYAIAGISLGLTIFFLIAYNQVEAFLEEFVERERNERAREKYLEPTTANRDAA